MPLRETVLATFNTHFRSEPVLVSAPGRINLIGEHTDYNEGYVLPAAIDRQIVAAIGENHTETWCRVFAVDRNSFLEFDLQFDVQYPEGAWENYVIGVAREMMANGYAIGGFDLVFAGDIPIGAGLSSSAALENSVVFGLNHLFELGLDRRTMARIAQQAEHHYAGVQCGIMDQMASMMGRQDQVMLLDCRSLKTVFLPLALEGYELLLVQSNVSHALASTEYNVRREECAAGLEILQEAYPKAKALRDVSLQQLEAAKDIMPSLLYDRCHYVVRENIRVIHSVLALEQGDVDKLGKILYSAHRDMRDLYAISCPEIDYLVEYARRNDAVIGARMMGGGFGGCTINIVKEGCASDFFNDALQERYYRRFGVSPEMYRVKSVDGVHLLR